jgi:hypothetical protein
VSNFGPQSLTDAVAALSGQDPVETEAALATITRSAAAAMVPDREQSRTDQPTFLGRRMATVIGVNLGPPLTADVEMNGVLIPGASPQVTYRPAEGDIVWLEFAGTDAHISPPLHSGSIQEAIDRAQSDGATCVADIGAGTFEVANLIVSNTGPLTLRGEGSGKTILRLPDDANLPLLSTENFAALVGTNDIGGVRKLKLSGITFDGNKTNQTTPADLVRIYGCDLWLEDVVIRNSSGKGLVTEWSTDPASPGGDSMESTVIGLRVHDCDGDGIFWNGPHDSQWLNVISYLNGGINVDLGPNAYAILVVNGHTWGLGSTVGWKLQASGIQLINTTGEGSSVAQVQVLANDVFVHGFFFEATGGGKGIEIGSGSIDVAGVNTDVRLLNFATGAIDWAGDVGTNRVKAYIYQTTGVEEVGTNHPDTMVELMMNGRVGQISRSTFKGRAQADGMDVNGNLTARSANDFQVKVETTNSGSERTRIAFQKNGVEKWIIFTDSGDNDTHDWFLYDAVNAATRIHVDAAGLVTFPNGDIEVATIGNGLIFKSPDGTRYRIQVANGGALSTTPA